MCKLRLLPENIAFASMVTSSLPPPKGKKKQKKRRKEEAAKTNFGVGV